MMLLLNGWRSILSFTIIIIRFFEPNCLLFQFLSTFISLCQEACNSDLHRMIILSFLYMKIFSGKEFLVISSIFKYSSRCFNSSLFNDLLNTLFDAMEKKRWNLGFMLNHACRFFNSVSVISSNMFLLNGDLFSSMMTQMFISCKRNVLFDIFRSI